MIKDIKIINCEHKLKYNLYTIIDNKTLYLVCASNIRKDIKQVEDRCRKKLQSYCVTKIIKNKECILVSWGSLNEWEFFKEIFNYYEKERGD